jgi:hypothetical protein
MTLHRDPLQYCPRCFRDVHWALRRAVDENMHKISFGRRYIVIVAEHADLVSHRTSADPRKGAVPVELNTMPPAGPTTGVTVLVPLSAGIA